VVEFLVSGAFFALEFAGPFVLLGGAALVVRRKGNDGRTVLGRGGARD
jgi:hypothetical protein